MNVLSLFDGMSCARIALDRANIPVTNYYASEIDKYAIKVSQANYPDIIQLGDVQDISFKQGDIDLLIGGSPCQGFSFAGKQLNFEDPRSKLFFEYVRILKESKPKYFLLENVIMKQESQDIITEMLGVEPVMINSSLVSAQNRKRLYWANIPEITKPEDKDINLKDILLSDAQEPMLSNIYGGFKEQKPRIHFNKSVTIRTASGGGHIPSLVHTEKAIEYMNRQVKDGRTHWDFNHHSDASNNKSSCITANMYKGVPYNVLVQNNCIRKLDPVECERLQTVPDNYTAHVSNTQRYKMLGNGFTVDVIAHILKGVTPC
jgi:DNA-cytosine methyltransferase